jgi:hypothetical protein
MAGVGGAELAVAPPPHAEAARKPTRASNERLGKRVEVTFLYYGDRVLFVAMVRPGWPPL